MGQRFLSGSIHRAGQARLVQNLPERALGMLAGYRSDDLNVI
jgi:hypothetical protein